MYSKISYKKHTDNENIILYEVDREGVKIPVFKYPALEKTGIVNHLFTTRFGGVSEGIYSSMNLSYSRGDNRESVDENFRRIAAALDSTVENIVCSDQTHTTNVLRVGKEHCGNGTVRKNEFHDIDGMITNEKGVVLATFYADCVPLYFVDRVNAAIGLSHSGWKGTAGRMGKVTIDAMKREFGTKPENLICAIGPSICRDCYEVNSDVAEVFLMEFPQYEEQILEKKKNGKYQLDLWRVNEIILMEAGVPEKNIITTNVCTCCNESLLFSHRASQGKRGNLGAFLVLK